MHRTRAAFCATALSAVLIVAETAFALAAPAPVARGASSNSQMMRAMAAHPFDANTLISDARYTQASSMSLAGIRTFLAAQPGVLKSGTFPDHNGAKKSAALIIANASASWGISPRVVLATMQKEESLLSDASPSAHQLNWAMGCGSASTFGKQIWLGTRALSRDRAGYAKGVKVVCGDGKVYPKNASTYGLYRYTPWIGSATGDVGGNYLFSSVYWRYFGDPLQVPQSLPQPGLSPGTPKHGAAFVVSGRVDTVVETTSTIRLTIQRLVGRTFKSYSAGRIAMATEAASYRVSQILRRTGTYAIRAGHFASDGTQLSRSTRRTFVVR